MGPELDGATPAVTPTDATAVPTDLRHRRQTLALSPAALAGVLGVHPTSVLRWERRERLPGPAHIRRLAAVLELSTPQVAGFFHAARAPAPATGFRGHGLRRLRAAAGRSAVALAAAAGVPVSTVYNWEAGRSPFRIDTSHHWPAPWDWTRPPCATSCAGHGPVAPRCGTTAPRSGGCGAAAD